MGDKLARDVESTNALRSTKFHEYCATGEWPDLSMLEEADVEEIQKWKFPTSIIMKELDIPGKSPGKNAVMCEYGKSDKEGRVSLDEDFNFVETKQGLSPVEIGEQYPNVLVSGSFDMAWHFPEHSLVIVEDIKSSIFAVKARTESLQLHAYGIAYAKKMGADRYIVGIWDASEGRHYFGQVVELDSFECEEYCARIEKAAKHVGENYVQGTHCSQCWVRSSCPSHLAGVPDSDAYRVMRAGATESDARAAMVEAKRLTDQSQKLSNAVKSWVKAHGYIRSEDGRMRYGLTLSSGRKSLDQAAVKRALGVKSLDDFMKEGRDFSTSRWSNIKD